MRVALVTGGGRGIGRAIALALGGPDTFVAVAGRTMSHLQSAAVEIESLGGRSLAIEMDVTSESSVADAVARLRDAAGHVDVLVNNAGIGGGEPIAGSDIARWRRTIDTNLTGIYLVTREVTHRMPPRSPARPTTSVAANPWTRCELANIAWRFLNRC